MIIILYADCHCGINKTPAACVAGDNEGPLDEHGVRGGGAEAVHGARTRLERPQADRHSTPNGIPSGRYLVNRMKSAVWCIFLEAKLHYNLFCHSLTDYVTLFF